MSHQMYHHKPTLGVYFIHIDMNCIFICISTTHTTHTLITTETCLSMNTNISEYSGLICTSRKCEVKQNNKLIYSY